MIMSKVVYKTSASNNNDFQRALMKTLKTMGIHPNVGLDILETDDKKVVIQKWGGWNYEINFKADETPKTKNQKVIIHETYHDNVYHVSLTPEQMDFLQWLEDRGLLSHEMTYDRIEDLEFEEI
jgi:hypothetical protein